MASSMLSPSASLVPDNDDPDADLDYIGSFQTKIVGVQYYTGEVNPHEMVLLEREPDNPYDRWAIRVDNINHEKVGHVPRVVVEHLSPLIDRGKVSLEATIPYGHTNTYSIPLTVYCYGKAEDAHAIARAVNAGGGHLQQPRVALLPSPISSPLRGLSLQQSSGAGASTSRGSGAPRAPAPAPAARRLTAAEVAKRVESVLDGLIKDETARPMKEPPPLVSTPLYAHQKEALAWMMGKENDEELPVFWEGASQGGYVHSLCNFTQLERPAPMRGGILADDMGLGKSLTTISLICTNAPGGPMTLPDPEEATQPAEKEDQRAPKRQRRSQAATSSKKKGNASKSKPTPKPSIAAVTSPTLILCPLSVMAGWEQQFEDHTAPGALKVHTYHGANRDRRVPFLSGHHVVISTYSTLAAEFRESARNGLLGVKWFRVVADEGHVLKNPKTQTAQAARKLKTERRWIISGTPIQNSLKDLHGLLGFLKLEPLTERALFRRTIERPVAEGNPNGVKRLQALVGALALRRTKETRRDGRPLVTLPRKSVFEVPVELDGESRAKYDRWFAASMRMIQHHLAENTLLENFTAVLTMILRLRQLAADPSLVSEEDPMLLELFKTSSSAPATCLDEETRERLVATLRAGLEGECPVCLDPLSVDPAITPCAHIFCSVCIRAVIDRDKPTCPLCRAHIEERDLVKLPPEPASAKEDTGGASATAIEDAAATSSFTPGPKVAALLQRLTASEIDEKHVVFSQFTGMLNLVETALHAAGLAFCRLDGSTPAPKRSRMLREFADPQGPRIFLISLKAGGVGLNLTAANHCHLLDPWWNPAVEEQAADRVHRLGQTRPVSIWRYISENTIEQRLLALQESKRQLMQRAFERQSAARAREARVSDVRILMDIDN